MITAEPEIYSKYPIEAELAFNTLVLIVLVTSRLEAVIFKPLAMLDAKDAVPSKEPVIPPDTVSEPVTVRLSVNLPVPATSSL